MWYFYEESNNVSFMERMDIFITKCAALVKTQVQETH